MVGDLTGSLNGAPLTVGASGRDIDIRVHPSLGGLVGLWRSRNAAKGVRAPGGGRLGLDVRVRLGRLTVARRTL